LKDPYDTLTDLVTLTTSASSSATPAACSCAQEKMNGSHVGDRTQPGPWHLRWFYTVTRRMLGKELTPVKIQARVPHVVWAAILVEACLSGRRRVSLRYTQLARIRAASCVGCPF
jgi:hypothetical protein